MKGAAAIMKREWRSYFYSPVAYVVIGLFLFLMGILFAKFIAIYAQYLFERQMGSRSLTINQLSSSFYQNMSFILCFVTPAVTMRLFAEEKRQQTFELLFTAPLKRWELVAGKFFAAVGLMTVMIAISFIYAFFIILWGNPEVAMIGTTYLGLFLALCCYISVGALISALTNSQAIAFVLTFVALLLLWLLQALGSGITATWGPIEWGPTLVFLSPLGHFNNFVEGLLQVKDIVYFITFTGVMLFLTYSVVESNRWR